MSTIEQVEWGRRLADDPWESMGCTSMLSCFRLDEISFLGSGCTHMHVVAR